jgi:hypothetical protein
MDEKLTGKLSSIGSLGGSLSENKSLSGQLSFKIVESSNYDYNRLKEETLPQINNVILKGNKTSSDLKVQSYMDEITYQEIDNLIFG